LLKHKLATILSIGIIIRLILIPLSAHPFDVYAWYNHSTNILQNGPLALQGFPPLWYHYMMVPIAYVYNWLAGIFHTSAIPMSLLPSGLNFYPSFGIQYVPGWLFNTVVKFPFLLSDILVTLLLYKIVYQLTNKKDLAEKAALLWFLNPVVIWISAGWGMWDTLPALFSLAGFYFTLKKRYAVSAVFISLGVACKLYPLLFVVPILIYIQRTTAVEQKRKSTFTFVSVFLIFSLLLFLPYLNTIINFFSNYFLPTTITQTSNFVTDQINNPLGFGLTYWTLFLLNRFFNFAISSSVISFGSLFSVALFILGLIVGYWKTTRISFNNYAYDLALIMFLPVAVLFLTYRIICEQFFIWLIPFLIILVIGQRMKPIFYWGISMVAILYAILNCPFPFFFLPLAPLGPNTLLGMVNFMLSNETLRISSLAFLGCAFSILLLIILRSAYKKRDYSVD
jgi:GPI mannosyltransferase 1 subunit M